jgi:hypothetical protein
MPTDDEALQLLREIRDLQREQLAVVRESVAKLEARQEKWMKSQEARYSQYQEECLGAYAKQEGEYEKTARSYARMTAAYTAMSVAIIAAVIAGIFYCFWPR